MSVCTLRFWATVSRDIRSHLSGLSRQSVCLGVFGLVWSPEAWVTCFGWEICCYSLFGITDEVLCLSMFVLRVDFSWVGSLYSYWSWTSPMLFLFTSRMYPILSSGHTYFGSKTELTFSFSHGSAHGIWSAKMFQYMISGNWLRGSDWWPGSFVTFHLFFLGSRELG